MKFSLVPAVPTPVMKDAGAKLFDPYSHDMAHHCWSVMLEASKGKKTPAACYDCSRPYGDEHGFPDLIISNRLWNKISPTKDEGGLLCPSCICKRVHDLRLEDGVERLGVGFKFTSGPFALPFD